MDRIVGQSIPVSRVATITAVTCRLLVGYLADDAVALLEATNSSHKYLKFTSPPDDAFIVDVHCDASRCRVRFGACNV